MLFSVALLAGLAAAFPQMGPTGPAPGPAGPGAVGPGPAGSPPPSSPPPGPASGPAPNSASLPWQPAGPGDSRSPCPALNTLANHFLLPHNGRNISLADVLNAFAVGQNFDQTAVMGPFNAAIAVCESETGANCTTFDLDMLDKPHFVEHDNSLSREDYNFGSQNNSVFSPAIWNQVLRVWEGQSVINFTLANAALKERVAVANTTDEPGWYVNASANTAHESAFYMSLFGDPVDGNARKDWINYWFTQEKLPIALGWNATQRQTITGASLSAMQAKIVAA